MNEPNYAALEAAGERRPAVDTAGLREAHARLRRLISFGGTETVDQVYRSPRSIVSSWERCQRDKETLALVYFEELDHSPITPELLAADGWEQTVESVNGGRWVGPAVLIKYDDQPFVWFEGVGGQVTLTTIGELRTLVRLHQQRLAAQSVPASGNGGGE